MDVGCHHCTLRKTRDAVAEVDAEPYPSLSSPRRHRTHAPGSPGAPSPRMSRWAALPLARALGAAPACPDLDMELGGLVSHFSVTTAGVSLPLVNWMKGGVSMPCVGKGPSHLPYSVHRTVATGTEPSQYTAA